MDLSLSLFLSILTAIFWDSECVVVLYPSSMGHEVAHMHIVNFTIKPTYAHMV